MIAPAGFTKDRLIRGAFVVLPHTPHNIPRLHQNHRKKKRYILDNNYVPQKLPTLVHLFQTHQGRPGASLGAVEHQLVERMLDEAEEEFKIGIILVYMRIVDLKILIVQ